MGRKSALTDKQWQEIGEKLLAGQKGRELAREYKIAESAIRKRFGAQTKQIKTVVNQVLAAETALKALPISAQISAQGMIEQMRSISGHLLSAANYGAASAHRLSALANAQVQKIDDANPEKSGDALKLTSVLTSMSNESSKLGVALISANKDTMAQIDPDEDLDAGTLTDEQIEAEITKTVTRLRVGSAMQA